MSDTFDAVILAGGQGTRLGGVSKADLMIGGERLLDRVLGAASGASSTVVVGRVTVPAGVLLTLEEPAGGGPAAGVAAGLAAIAEPAEWTLLLAVDLPDAPAAAARLRAAAASGEGDAFALRHPDSTPQFLAGLYRSGVLREAVRAYGDPRNRSVRGMLAPLEPVLVDPGEARVDDVDTWADHARWNARLRRRKTVPVPEDRSSWRPFIEKACAALDIDPELVDEDAILTLAREIAHAGARPMAPVSTFMLGLAVGRGGEPEYLRRVLEDAVSAAPVPPAATEEDA